MTNSQYKTKAPACKQNGTTLKMLKRDAFTECWLTVLARQDLEPAEAAKQLFDSVAGVLAENKIEVIQEKIYGAVRARSDIERARARSYNQAGLPLDLPFTFLEGVPVNGGSLAGIQIWGIIAAKDASLSIETIEQENLPAARLIKAADFKMLYLPSVIGSTTNGALPQCVTEQAEHMFINGEKALNACGMNFRDVARTWIYLSRISHWYGEFNRVRTEFFKEHSIGDEKIGHAFPASTGIQCRSAGEECLMDVLAVKAEKGSSCKVRPLLHSSRQNQAFKYGSAFSRGISISVNDEQTVHISGTASIGPDGKTRYLEAEEAQIMETLLSIAALLEPVGGGLSDISSSTLFCKSPSVLESYQHVSSLLGIPNFPFVPVVADVCRPELLVEIEAVATISAKRKKPDCNSEKNSARRSCHNEH